LENGRSRRRHQYTALFLILLAVFFFVTAGAVFVSQSRGSSAVSYPDVEGIDENAHDSKLGLHDRIFGIQLNDADQFSYAIRKSPTFDSETGVGTVNITNPPENRYLMAVEITLDGEDEVLSRTGYLKPNQTIDTITLEEPLAAGEYDATAHFCAFDFETMGLLGILEQPITIVVK
jgi:hypothetical protein